MEARNRSLTDWLHRVRSRQLVLPRFQRHEAWRHSQIEDLLETVLDGLPVGAVLILEVGQEEPFISRAIVSAPETGDRVNEHLLDGQQRLTALWRSLHGNYEERNYFVQQSAEASGGWAVQSFARWMTKGKKYPVWIDDPLQQWQKGLIPVELLRPDANAQTQLKQWVKQACPDGGDAREELRDSCDDLRQRFAAFNVPFLSLPAKTTPHVALNVFMRMNTSASRLSAYDIVVAQVEAATQSSLHEWMEELEESAPGASHYLEPQRWVLAVGALLQDKVPNESIYLSREYGPQLAKDWPKIRSGIERAVAFLEEEHIFNESCLATEVVLYPLAAIWADVPDGLDTEGAARLLLRKYLWRAFVTNRYEKTSATRALADCKQLRETLRKPVTQPEFFDESKWPLPTIEEITGAGWPKQKERLARAVLAMSLRGGAYDWADARPADRASLSVREYHHIFPQNWLRTRQVAEADIQRALNCAWVTWKTNRNIAAKIPSQYLDERVASNQVGEAEVSRRLASHLVPLSPIKTNDYEAFIRQRAEIMQRAMRRLCDGQLPEF